MIADPALAIPSSAVPVPQSTPPTLPNVTKRDSSTIPAPISAVTDPIAETCARVTNGELNANTGYNTGDDNELADVTSPQALAAIEQLPEHLSPRQAQAMDLLLAGFSIAEVASRVGVSRQTIYRWRYNHPTFMSIYGRLTQEMSEQAGHRAEQLVYRALDIVQAALSAKKPSPGQLNAAIRVLSALRVSRFTFTPSTPTTYREAFDKLMCEHYKEETGKDLKNLDEFDRGSFACKLLQDNETESPGGQPVLPKLAIDPVATQTSPVPGWTPPSPPLPLYSPVRKQQQAVLDALWGHAHPKEWAKMHPECPIPPSLAELITPPAPAAPAPAATKASSSPSVRPAAPAAAAEKGKEFAGKDDDQR